MFPSSLPPHSSCFASSPPAPRIRVLLYRLVDLFLLEEGQLGNMLVNVDAETEGRVKGQIDHRDGDVHDECRAAILL